MGFYYLKNHPIPQEDLEAVAAYAPRFFELPDEEKERIRMVHSPHFFGYSRFGAELTKGKVDQREQFDFGTSAEVRWKEGDPKYMKLWGPSQVCTTHARPCSSDAEVGSLDLVARRGSATWLQGDLCSLRRSHSETQS